MRTAASCSARRERSCAPSAAGGAGITLEQPCATLDDCAALRSIWGGPMVLDENTVSLAALLAGHRAGIADGITVKLSRVGGITPGG